MNPLSAFTYYRRHKSSTALLVIIIGLVTLAVGAMVSVLDSFTENLSLDIAYLDSLSSVHPAAGYELDPGIAAQVRAHPDVERVIPEAGLTIQHPQLIGLSWVRLLVIPVEEMPGVLRACGLRVDQGRLPAEKAPELALSVDTARSLGLRLGDRISRATKPEYYFDLSSELTLVGLLDQDPAAGKRNVRLGLISYEYLTGHEDYTPRATGLLVIARPGRIAALNRFLETLPASVADIETKNYHAAVVGRMNTTLRLLFAVVDLLVAGVAAVVAGVINQVAISRRLPEFGLLHAVGWRKRALLRRVAGGTAIAAVLGWLAGLVGVVLLVTLGRSAILDPRGQEWPLNIWPFLYTLPIPLVVVGFTVASIWRVLGRLDAVAIIERGKLSMEETGSQKQVRRSSARPLSSWTFYLRHRRRGLLLVAAMALMIVGVAVPVFIILPVLDSQMPAMEYLRYVSEALPGAGNDLDPGIVAQVRAHPSVARVVPDAALYMGISVPPFSQSQTVLYAVSQDDMSYLMDRFGLHLIEGRLPRPSSSEIVLSEALALNRGLQIGDSIGNPVNDRDSFPIELTIVGLLETEGLWIGFAPLEYVKSHELTAHYAIRLLVAPEAGGKAALDAWLLENVDSSTTVVDTYDKEWRRLQRYRVGALLVLGAVLSLVAIIAAAALAVLNAIFFFQRREEFGTLSALGRGQGWLTWRTGRETLATTAVAWLVGAALCVGVVLYLQLAVYAPRGLSVDLTSIAPWLFTLPIPLAVVAGSVGTTGWILKRLDAVAVIEGR
jgi:ABC-type lipoprotein release transport system permease subunit